MSRKLFFVFALSVVISSQAQAIVINFNNTEVPTITNLAPVTTQWNGFGIGVSNAYWYTDSRDPFDQMGLSVFPIFSSNVARIDLLTGATNSINVDWLTLTGTIFIDAYDAANNLLDSFSGSGFGNVTLTGPNISYFTFHDTGGFIAISTLTYVTNPSTSVPEPPTILVIGLGLVALSLFRYRTVNS